MRLIELLVSVLVASLLVLAAGRVARLQGDSVRALTLQARKAEAVRTTISLLDWEMASGDATPLTDEVLRVRSLRGRGQPCARIADETFVIWLGRRTPDAGRDSVRLVLDDGTLEVVPLVSARRVSESPGSCPTAGVWGLRWEANDASLDLAPVHVQLFEAGQYELGSALRYRGVSGSVQPLTADVFDPADVTWFRSQSAAVGLSAATADCLDRWVCAAPQLGVGVRLGTDRGAAIARW